MDAKEARVESLKNNILIIHNKIVTQTQNSGVLKIAVEVPIPLSEELMTHYQDLGYEVTIQKTTTDYRTLHIGWSEFDATQG